MDCYVVYYYWDEKGNWGTGRSGVSTGGHISKHEDIIEIADQLKDENNYKNVIIINIIKLPL